MRTTFEWDDKKDQEDQRKHGVAFADAQKLSLIRRVLSCRIEGIARVRKGIIALELSAMGY